MCVLCEGLNVFEGSNRLLCAVFRVIRVLLINRKMCLVQLKVSSSIAATTKGRKCDPSVLNDRVLIATRITFGIRTTKSHPDDLCIFTPLYSRSMHNVRIRLTGKSRLVLYVGRTHSMRAFLFAFCPSPIRRLDLCRGTPCYTCHFLFIAL